MLICHQRKAKLYKHGIYIKLMVNEEISPEEAQQLEQQKLADIEKRSAELEELQ